MEARLFDLVKRAQKGDLAVSAFLSPKERHDAEEILGKSGCAYAVYGGYADAERRRIYLLPSYMEECEEFLEGLSAFGYESGIATLKVKGSGYVDLTHRDFLGALLGLGLERSVLGDIVLSDSEPSAIVFCEDRIVPFLLEEWRQVGRDKVSVERVSLPPDFAVSRRVEALTDTVASARLDCIVASLCHMSRERAKTAVESGLVELDFVCRTRPDQPVEDECLISVRGYGKYRVISTSEKTKKGRYRLRAEKFI